MLELSIAIWMTCSLQDLAIGLEAISQIVENLGDHAMARLMAHSLQFLRQTTNAFTSPPQGRFWLSTLGGLHKLLQIRLQRQVGIDRPFASSARPPNSTATRMRFRDCLEILDTPADCESRYSCCTRHLGDSPESNHFSLRSDCQTTSPLIEMGLDKLKPSPNRLFISHCLLSRIQQKPSRGYTLFRDES